MADFVLMDYKDSEVSKTCKTCKASNPARPVLTTGAACAIKTIEHVKTLNHGRELDRVHLLDEVVAFIREQSALAIAMQNLMFVQQNLLDDKRALTPIHSTGP